MTNETINPIDGLAAAPDAPIVHVAQQSQAGTDIHSAASEYGPNGGWTDEVPAAVDSAVSSPPGGLQSNQLEIAGSGVANDDDEPQAANESEDDEKPSISARLLPTSLTEQSPALRLRRRYCLNRALRIARSLNHTSLSADHLMLALTLDPTARRHLERVGDVALLREAAMLRLGKTNWKYARGASVDANGDPSPTADFDEIRKVARDAAAERDQKVAISDLINGFQTESERLTYGRRDLAEAVPAVLDRIENGLVPRVADFMSRFESEVRDGAQRQVAAVLQDFGELKLK